MHIEKLRLNNVRQFAEAKYSFNKGFNLLVGENGFGKTTVLRSIFMCLGSPRKISLKRHALNNLDIRLGEDSLQILTSLVGDNHQKRDFQYQRRFGDRLYRGGDKSDIKILFYGSNEALVNNLRGRPPWTPKNKSSTRNIDFQERIYQLEHESKQRPQRVSQPANPTSESSVRGLEIRAFLEDALSRISDRITKFHWRFEAYSCSLNRVDEKHLGDKEEAHFVKDMPELLMRIFQLNPDVFNGIEERSITINADGFIKGNEKLGIVSTPFRQLAQVALEVTDLREPSFIDSYVAEVKLVPRIVIDTPDGSLPIGQLSDGEQRLLSLFIDIAWNLSLDPSSPITESSAIILIDEIDVHLHPRWQRMIVPYLEELFPSCQFIATTHSPFVIQSVPVEKIMKVTKAGPHSFEAESRSIEDIVEDIQGIDLPQRGRRAEELSKAATRYFSLLREEPQNHESIKEAKLAYREASEPFTSHPALHALLKSEELQHEDQ
ncbi:MAG: AAA family ATPase [Roseibacillus sp.]